MGALGVSALACVVVAALAWRHQDVPGATALGVLALAELWWIVTYAAELAVDGADPTFLLSRLEWVGVVTIPVAWMVFTLRYTGRSDLLTRRRVAALSTLPAAAAVAALTWYEPLIRTDVDTVVFDGATVVTGGFGQVFLVFSVFAWMTVAAGALVLVEFVLEERSLYRRRTLALLAAAVIPLASSVLFVAGVVPRSVIDPTPVAFALSSSLSALAILEFDLFDSAPVASGVASAAAVEAMSDPLVVVDSSGVIADRNPAATRLLADGDGLVGRSAEAVLPVEDPTAGAAGRTVTVDQGDTRRHFDVRTAAIDGGDHDFGAVVTFRDVTPRAERQQRLDALNDVLCATLQEEIRGLERPETGEEGSPPVNDVELLKTHAAAAASLSESAGELVSIVSPESFPPADIVPIIESEIEHARELYPEVTFVSEAALGEWAYCSGLFEPLFRVSLRAAAERAERSEGESVIAVSVDGGDGPDGRVTVVVSVEGPPLTDRERAVVIDGADPDEDDDRQLRLWLIHWAVDQAGGRVTVSHDPPHVRLELRLPRERR